MIDLHSHILPGVDDGAATLADSLEIARACVEDGISLVAATPHVRGDYPTDADTMERLVAELRLAFDEVGIELTLRGGGEIALDWIDSLTLDKVRRFGLAGNPNYVLLEFPYYGWPLALPSLVSDLCAEGIVPVLAHPERNADVQASPERLRPLVEAGALVQVTAASLDGRVGQKVRRAGLQLVRSGLAHLLASDAHHAGVRAAGMASGVAAVGDSELAEWLATTVPDAIVNDRPPPPRPQAVRRRRWR